MWIDNEMTQIQPVGGKIRPGCVVEVLDMTLEPVMKPGGERRCAAGLLKIEQPEESAISIRDGCSLGLGSHGLLEHPHFGCSVSSPSSRIPVRVSSFFQNLAERGEVPRLPEDIHPEVAAIQHMKHLIARGRPRSPWHRRSLHPATPPVIKRECPPAAPWSGRAQRSFGQHRARPAEGSRSVRQKNKLKRSQMVAQGLRLVMQKAG
jgi:hypothetical protein